jgi:hypothetical protein
MSSPQEQYAEAIRSGQEAVATAFESWTKSAQNAFGAAPGRTTGSMGTDQVIDQVFDFAARMLEVQREFAKSLAATAAAAAAARDDAASAATQPTDEAPPPRPSRARKT